MEFSEFFDRCAAMYVGLSSVEGEFQDDTFALGFSLSDNDLDNLPSVFKGDSRLSALSDGVMRMVDRCKIDANKARKELEDFRNNPEVNDDYSGMMTETNRIKLVDDRLSSIAR